MPPCRSAQMSGVVVGHACEQEAILGELIPLFAGDFAGFASDAKRRIRKETFPAAQVTFLSLLSDALNPCFDSGLCRASGKSRSSILGAFLSRNHPEVTCRRPLLFRPGSIVPVNAFDSWMETFGSATNPIKSLAASPRTKPLLDQ